MQNDQPQFYANLASHLSAEEQALIQDILVRAEEVAQAQLQAQQAEAAANGGANWNRATYDSNDVARRTKEKSYINTPLCGHCATIF